MALLGFLNAQRSDEQLVARVQAGDEGALRVLFERHSGRVLSLSRRVLGGTSEAEEIVQETFLEIWRNAVRFDASKGAAAAWICGIARNRTIDRLRSHRSRQQAVEGLKHADKPAAPASDEQLHAKRAEARIARELSALPDEQRQVIQLAYYEGLSQSEIAERTGDPLGTVKGRARAALEKLAATLNKELA